MLGSPIVLLLLGGLSLVLYLVLPAALFLFHRRSALRSALERLDPVPRWTDRCPAPVLSLSLSFAVSALLCLPLARGPLPLFGWTLTGAGAWVAALLAAAAFGVLAVATYRLSPAGWWGSLAAVIVFTIVSVDMAFRVDLGRLLAEGSLAPAGDPGAGSGAAGSASAGAGAAGTAGAAAADGSGWLLGGGSLLFGAVCVVALVRLRRHFDSSRRARESV